MPSASEVLASAVSFHQSGRLQEAEAAYRLALQLDPFRAQAWYYFGGLAYQLGNPEVATQLLRRAAELDQNSVEYAFNLGLILHEQKQLDDAEMCFRRVLALKPDALEPHIELSAVLSKTNRDAEAEAILRRGLAVHPQSPALHSRLGLVLHRLGRAAEAADCHRQAIAWDPASADDHFHLGNALADLEQRPEAIAAYRRAIELAPTHAGAHTNLGNALHGEGQRAEAIAMHRQALELDPKLAAAHNNLGNVLRDQGQPDEARVLYEQALALDPDFAEAIDGRGVCLRDKGQLDDALACFQRACNLKPAYASARANLGTTLRDLSLLPQAVAAFRQAMQIKPSLARAHANLLFTLWFTPGWSQPAIYDEHTRYNQQHAVPLLDPTRTHANDQSPGRRLRIGYVSPNFRNHVQALYLVPLLSSHDHDQFEIFAYSDVTNPDHVTDRLRPLVDHWRDTGEHSDEALDRIIHQDQIDILVDLTMHMAQSRLLVFARKPAPVQVTWLAYPGTTGLTAIDYRLSDPQLDPPGLFDGTYSEKTILLPDTFWCFDQLDDKLDPGPLPALAAGHVTFGNLNSFTKTNPGTLQLWARVMRNLPDSRLLLLVDEGTPRQRVHQLLSAEGIDPSRVQFVGLQPSPEYLRTYQRIDIVLDTLPYNGHTTTLDSLWMGVPVVTRVGDTIVGRAGLSMLTNVGLTELITHSDDQFVQVATDLARSLPRLAKLKASLRSRIEASPLMNHQRFTRAIEQTYRQIWQDWCQAEKAAG